MHLPSTRSVSAVLRPTWRIRTRLVATFMLLVFLAALGTGAASVFVTFMYGKQRIVERLDSIASLKEAQIETWLDSLESELGFAQAGSATLPLMRNALDTRVAPEARREARESLRAQLHETRELCAWLHEIFLVDAEGIVAASSSPQTEGEYRGLLEYYREGLRGPGAHVQTIVFTSASERFNTVVVVRPVAGEDGTTVGILCGRAKFRRLNRIMLHRTGFGETGETYLAGSNQVLLTETRSPEFTAGSSYLHTEPARRAVREQASGIVFAKNYRGEPVVSVYRWLPSLNIALIAEQSQAEALQPVYMSMLFSGLAAIVATILAASVSLYMARRISAPLMRLSGAAQRIAEGELEQEIPVERHDEIGLLAGAFNNMSRWLAGAFKSLEESRERFRALVETTSDWIWETDAEGVYRYVSPRAQSLLGYGPDELIGRNLRHLAADPESYLDGLFTKEAASHIGVVGRVRHKDGHDVIVETSCVPILDGAGRVQGWRGIDRDITARIRAEVALNQSRQTSADIVRHIPSGLFIYQFTAPRSLKLIEGNDEARRLTGISIDKYRGIEFDELWPRAHEHGLTDQLLELLRTGKPLAIEEFAYGDNHVAGVYRIRAFSVPGDRVVVAFEDVTERKRAEIERQRIELQMQQAQKLESLGILAGGIAHDFNNLLTTILGNIDLASQDLSDVSPARPSLKEAERAALRAAELCKQMLAYSGKGRFEWERFDLSELVDEMVHILKISISKKAVLRCELARDLPPIVGDATQVRQIIMNLITNGSEALEDRSGVVSIVTGASFCELDELRNPWTQHGVEAGTYVYVEVTDTGCGMDESVLKRIFDPFFTTKFTGRGLGLAAVLGIVRGHKGVIKIDSAPGQGSTIRVLFPAAEPVAAAAAPTGSAEDTWTGAGTILLVDDEDTIRAVGKRMLERLGFKVLLAADGVEALDLYAKADGAIVCVLLDLTMPRMDGAETFRELRRRDGNVPIIMSSGHPEHEVTERDECAGMAGFIPKPFQMSDLRKKLRDVLGG